MSEWMSSAGSSYLGIALIVIAAFVLLKFFKDIAKPIIYVALIVCGVLLVFNIIDLALIAAGGKKLLSTMWSSCSSGCTATILPWLLP